LVFRALLRKSGNLPQVVRKDKSKPEVKGGENMEHLEQIILEKNIQEEKVPEIPAVIKQYLDLKNHQSKGKFFTIEIKEESRNSGTDGIAYLNELVILYKGKEIYSTGMMQYRGAYNWEIDNFDLQLLKAKILEESANKVTYAFATGAGNIKVYTCTSTGDTKLVEKFNINDYENAKARQKQVEKLLEDSSAWFDYIRLEEGHRWHIKRDYDDEAELNHEEMRVILAEHSDRDYDAVTDYYKFYFWVKGKGIGESRTYRTGLIHPPYEKYYYYGIRIESAELAAHDILKIRVGCKSQSWKTEHVFQLITKE